MSAIRRRRAAREDILDIWSFIADDNIRAADALVDRFDRAFLFLVRHPEAGRLRPDIGSGIRSFVVGKYVVFYRVTSAGIDVGRVVHGARNIVPADVWPSFDISANET
jgi:toxin ParE1/3/4